MKRNSRSSDKSSGMQDSIHMKQSSRGPDKSPGRSVGKGSGRISIGSALSWAAVVVWMAFIFYLSSQVAEQSNQLSTGITETIIGIIRKLIPNAKPDLNSFNHFVRKNAHFFAYLVLGLLTSNVLVKNKPHSYKRALFALLICALYAVSDEVHQLYVPGRGSQVTDVLIDSAGALVGSGFYFILSRLRHRAISA